MCMENSINAVVRRLTPLECERLQGFPDGWTDIGEWTDSKGKVHKPSDTPRYKALGNSIALPYWEWLADRVAKSLGDDDLTMGSLFDGIGGFPLAFQRAGVRPVWASEIEEFPIAVTKKRFPEGRGMKYDPEPLQKFSVSQTVCIEGNGSRESHKGNGYRESETMYTLNTVEQHAVCYRKETDAEEEQLHTEQDTDKN